METRVSEGDAQAFVVSGGAIRGANQFHRFSAFALSSDQSVRFKAPPGASISNLINLVSGDDASIIDGDIDTSEYAGVNFFLLNPQGIVFGKHASLNRGAAVDVAGSFHFSTANAIRLGETLIPVDAGSGALTGAPPVAVGFPELADEPLIVESSATGLRVRNGNLALVAPRIEIRGATLRTSGGDIELSTRVDAHRQAPIGQRLSVAGTRDLGDIVISDGTLIKAAANGDRGGSVDLSARDVTLGEDDPASEPSMVFASSRFNPEAALNISASGTIRLHAGDRLVGRKKGLDLRQTPLVSLRDFNRLEISDGAEIATRETGMGRRAGDIVIHGRAGSKVVLDGRESQIDASASGGGGIAGNVSITTDELTVRNNAEIQTTSTGSSDQPGLKAGDITISARKIALLSGRLRNGNSGSGQGGKVVVEKNDHLLITGENGGIFSQPFGDQKGGEINITSGSIEIRDGGRISASSRGAGESGDIVINASGRMLVSGEGAAVSVDTIGADAGEIRIYSSGLLQLDNGGAITTSSNHGEGDGGAILLSGVGRKNLLLLNHGARIEANTAAGTGGNVEIAMQSVLRPKNEPDDIQARAKRPEGVDGVVEFKTPDVDATTGVLELPSAFFDASALVGSRCVAESSHASSLSRRARQGLGNTPDSLLAGYADAAGSKGVATTHIGQKLAGLGDRFICGRDRPAPR